MYEKQQVEWVDYDIKITLIAVFHNHTLNY